MPGWISRSTTRVSIVWRERLNRWLPHRLARPTLFLLALTPFVWLVFAAATNRLGANPAEALIRDTGEWALRLLCMTLAVTPMRVQMGLPSLARWRRPLGLFTYFYASLHLLCYAWLDMGLEVVEIASDIAKRPFILVGFSTFLILTALAMTSWNGAVRRLGAARWRALHRLVYVATLLALLHFFWMRSGKNDYGEVQIYATVAALLLGWRLWRWGSARQRGGAAVGGAGIDQRPR